ncbi:hypothetical protein SBOR_3625 [Sclerotinia borealis F-4128]|uniref:Helicase ATP-binding domain-containing protein n=1 Tax=Sclerotinia borealis (strain F-4128) TaxID=1432307 RepID=W9CNC0_SCLBF|nr:hypothetical protein SBOR_3625 [Sclerotinia borealis F-4128]
MARKRKVELPPEIPLEGDPETLDNPPEAGDGGIEKSDIASSESDDESSSEEEDEPRPGQKPRGKKKRRPKKKKKTGPKLYTTLKYETGTDQSLCPLYTSADFIAELIQKLLDEGFAEVSKRLKSRPLRVATACSGTEAPILFLNTLSEGLKNAGLPFEIEHVFSCEIEPYKQTYIRRNFPGAVIFRDITEALRWKDYPELKGFMTTAFGALIPLPPPHTIDLIIAGTSCTSYSTLNSNRSMDLERDQNESSRTFRAYVKLIEYLKPKIGINENVGSGPFPAMVHMLNTHGYLAGWAIFDSKYFGIPQTRQRGYAVAVPQSSLEEVGLASKYSDANAWKADFDYMKLKFSRHASTSIEQWMEKSDSKTLRAQHELQGEPRAVVSWDTCHARHEDYRHGQGLGTGKPMTDWRSTGIFRHPDHWIRDMKGFVERVHDATDVSHLRGVSRGYDDRYISRNIDLSQNVYVQHDNVKCGIMPCLTPSGSMFNTARGSKITGEEALRLQGIDTAGLELGGLTQPELRNFAGNAMTTTVVGAVMAFALLTFVSVLTPGEDVDTVMQDEMPKTFRGEEFLIDSQENIAVVQRPLTVGQCLHIVETSAKFCYCEAQTDISRSTIVKCKYCSHVSCSSCGAKPRHAYEPLSEYVGPRGVKGTKPRVDPSTIEFDIANRLPMTILISKLFTSDGKMASFLQHLVTDKVDEAQWAGLRMSYLKCLQSTVKFQKPVRSFGWHFTWLADEARLELVLDDKKVQATLYALPDHTVAVNSRLRKYLAKFPLAKTVPLYASTHSSQNMFDFTWQFWQPKFRVVEAKFRYGGELIPVYHNSVGIPKHKEDLVWSQISIQIPKDEIFTFEKIVGVYESHAECGQAFNSMHTKKGTSGTDFPMYMFFDHEGVTGNWKKHTFVFTDDQMRMECGVFRQIIATIDCSWEQPVLQKLGDSYHFEGTIFEDLADLQKEMTELVSITSYGSWTTSSKIVGPMATNSFDHSATATYQRLDLSSPQLMEEADCKVLLTAFSCKALTDVIPPRWQTNCWTKVTKRNGIDFFRDCYHLLARGLVHPSATEASPPWIPGSAQENDTCRCRVCAPLKPDMLWHLKKNGVKYQQTPFENPEAAATFEHLTTSSPAAMEQWVRFTPMDRYFQFEFYFLVNPTALSHKAAALLDEFPRPNHPVNLSWRFIPGASRITRLPVSQFVYRDTQNLGMSDQPSRFVPGMKLRNEQLKTLTWMVQQERFPPSFVEREIVETRQDDLAFRLEGRACRLVKHRAGLLAASVGYGKTVMTFALMSRQYPVDRLWSENPNTDGLIHVKATLVLVPAHLTLQWRNEACIFLDYKREGDPRLIVLSTYQHVKALTVDDVLRAELVICSSSQFDNESYLKLVAKNAAVVDLAKNSTDRAKEAWYLNAKEERKANLLRLQKELPMEADETNEVDGNQGVKKFTSFMKEKYMKDFAASGANRPHIPSRRLRGAYHEEDDANANKGVKGKGKANISAGEDDAEKSFVGPEFETNCIRGLLGVTLGDFSWPRIVTDEVSYNTGNHIAVSIRELNAQARWALSATPNITDHLSASRVARCLGINLGVDDQETIRKDKNLTSAERFLSYGPDASPSWHAARIQIAQEFCNMFVRQDTRKGSGQFNRVHRFVPMPLATAQLACYLTIKSDVINKSYMMPKTVDTRSSVQEEMMKVYGKEQDGRLRLTKAASFFPEHAKKNTNYTLKTCRGLKASALGEIKVAKDYVRKQMELIIYLLTLPEVRADLDMGIRYSNWRNQILAGQRYADPDALRDIIQVINAVESAPPKTHNELYFMVPYAPRGRRLWPSPTLKIMHNGRKMLGLLADCRRALTELHKTGVDLIHSRQEYRYYKAVLEIDRAGSLSPTGSLACHNCPRTAPLSEAVVQGNCGHILCSECNFLLDEGVCPVKPCGGTSLDDQKYLALSMYSSAGHVDPHVDSEISKYKAALRSCSIDPSCLPRSSDYDFWSKPSVKVDKITAVRTIVWDNDDGFCKFLIFSPLPEFLMLAEQIITADGIPCCNLTGKKSEIAQILENFKNNMGMKYKEKPTRTRAPRIIATVPAAPAAPVQAAPVVQVVPVSQGSQKRKRADSEDVTAAAPVSKAARVTPAEQVDDDSDDLYGVSDRETERARAAGKLNKGKASASGSASTNVPEATAHLNRKRASPDPAASASSVTSTPDDNIKDGEHVDLPAFRAAWSAERAAKNKADKADKKNKKNKKDKKDNKQARKQIDAAGLNDMYLSQIPKRLRRGKKSASSPLSSLRELPDVPILSPSSNPEDYMMTSGLGFADVIDEDDQLLYDLVFDGFPGAVSESGSEVVSDSESDAVSDAPDLTTPAFIEAPMASYPALDPSELEDAEVPIPEAFADTSSPDDESVDWARVGQEAHDPEYWDNPDPTARVLLLNIADESAAGSNLTVAQHVIFLSPYYAEKTKYNAAMTQAMGRALREGQKVGSTVFVHHLLVKDTVEIDIACELMDDSFPGKLNAMPLLSKYKSNIGPAFFRK